MLGLHYDHWTWVPLCIAATWRLSSLLCYEEGPFGLLTRVRRALFWLRLGSLVECFHCASLWVSGAVVLMVFAPSYQSVLVILAVAGGASFAEIAVAHRR
jgi:hypothetical protein